MDDKMATWDDVDLHDRGPTWPDCNPSLANCRVRSYRNSSL